MMENKSDFHLLEEMKQEEASRPIYFNVMVVGGSGLGKSNFIDAFLHRKFQEGPVICEPTTEITYHYGQRD
jgi:septin family protein